MLECPALPDAGGRALHRWDYRAVHMGRSRAEGSSSCALRAAGWSAPWPEPLVKRWQVRRIETPSARIVERPARVDLCRRVRWRSVSLSSRVTTGSGFWAIPSSCKSRRRANRGAGRVHHRRGVGSRMGAALTGWKPWEDPQRWAGVVHDWLYSQPGISKSHADESSALCSFRRGQPVEAPADVCRRRRRRLVGLPSGPGQRSENLPLTLTRLATRFAGVACLGGFRRTALAGHPDVCNRRGTCAPNDDTGSPDPNRSCRHFASHTSAPRLMRVR